MYTDTNNRERKAQKVLRYEISSADTFCCRLAHFLWTRAKYCATISDALSSSSFFFFFFFFFSQGKSVASLSEKRPNADKVASLLSHNLDKCPIYTSFFLSLSFFIFIFSLLSASLLSVQLAFKWYGNSL